MNNYYNIKQKIYKSQKEMLSKQVKDIIIFKKYFQFIYLIINFKIIRISNKKRLLQEID